MSEDPFAHLAEISLSSDAGKMRVADLIQELAKRFISRNPDPMIPMKVHKALTDGTDLASNLYELLGPAGRRALYDNPELFLYVKAGIEDEVNKSYERFWRLLKQPEVRAMERAVQEQDVKERYGL